MKGDLASRGWPPRRIVTWSLVLLGFGVGIQHLVAHAGFQPVPLSMGWQDILLGYPMALALFVAGAMMADPHGG